jgi:WD40 repeat protein
MSESSPSRLQIWQAKRFYVADVTGEISDIFASADSRWLFTVDAIAVRAWDPLSGKMLITMAGCLEEAEAVAFSQDGSWLAAGDYYGTIWVWDAGTGNLHCTLGGGYSHGRMGALAATPGNRLLACQAGGPHPDLGHSARRDCQHHSLRPLPCGHSGGDLTGRPERHDLRTRHKRRR